jgi:hypothetical protein
MDKTRLGWKPAVLRKHEGARHVPKDFRAPGIAACRLTAREFKSHAVAASPANVAKRQRDVARQQQ